MLNQKGILKLESMGEYEKEKGYASYKTIIERYVGDIVLCNNIAEIDNSIWENGNKNFYDNDEPIEIYQYYLCNVGNFDLEQLEDMGIIMTYSDMLDCNVLCVDHYGTSWDYVLTDVKLFDNYEDLQKYENK